MAEPDLINVRVTNYNTTKLPIVISDTEKTNSVGFIYNVIFLVSHVLLTMYILGVTITGIVLISTNSYNSFVTGLLILFFVINFLSIISESTILLQSVKLINKKKYIKITIEKILMPVQILFATYIFNIAFYAIYGDTSFYGYLIVITDCIQLTRIIPSIILFRYC